jgi:hypothetical protein
VLPAAGDWTADAELKGGEHRGQRGSALGARTWMIWWATFGPKDIHLPGGDRDTPTDLKVDASSWPSIPCEAITRDWNRARLQLIEPYFQARRELSTTAAS